MFILIVLTKKEKKKKKECYFNRATNGPPTLLPMSILFLASHEFLHLTNQSENRAEANTEIYFATVHQNNNNNKCREIYDVYSINLISHFDNQMH